MPLIYFVLGILFVRCFLPLLDQLVSWTLTFIECKKTKIAVDNTKFEKTIEDIVNENNIVNRQIGFVVDNPEEYFQDEDPDYTEEETENE
jgi:hypothetical protein